MKELLRRRQRLMAKLPPLEEVLRGSIVERSSRCGRSTCHCAGSAGHPAIYLSVTLGGGRTEQLSLPPSVLATARRGVAIYQKWWSLVEELSAINRELLRTQRDRARAAPRGARGAGGGVDGSRQRVGRGGRRSGSR